MNLLTRGHGFTLTFTNMIKTIPDSKTVILLIYLYTHLHAHKPDVRKTNIMAVLFN